MQRALITGITGQDGSYLAEFLLEKGYIVYGLARRSSLSNFSRIQHLLSNAQWEKQFFIEEGDLSDSSSLKRVFEKVDFTEVYNLGAMSDVKTSFAMPEYALDVNGLGVLRLLEIIKEHNSKIRFYQASTSELFGKVQQVPQSEKTPFYPRSPYGVAKLYGYWIAVNYREAYGLFACNGILFNHESPRRGPAFVSRKITLAAARIAAGLQDKLLLGNLDAKRDWGYAKDYVEGMWLMLQQPTPDDYVLATGQTTTVRQFVELVFDELQMPIEWQSEGLWEKGISTRTGKVVIEVSPQFFRPSEVDILIGDASKARTKLGWVPKTSMKELVQLMVRNDQLFVSKAEEHCSVIL